MGATFNLADLIPEPLTFRDTDGKTYEAHTAEMFGAVDYAKLMRLQQQMRTAFATLQATAGQKKGDTEGVAAQLEAMSDTLIAMIVPDLPPERLAAMAFGHKFRFLKWWQEQATAGQPAGETKAAEKVIRGRRSPASSASTVSAPKTS